MLTNFFWLIYALLLVTSLLAMRLSDVNRKFSLAIVQALLFLPLLVVEYLALILAYIPVAHQGSRCGQIRSTWKR